MRFELGGFRPEMLFALLGRLLLIVLANEVLIMFVYRGLGFTALSEPGAAILDGVLLTVLSLPPIYFWIIVPVLQERRRTDDTLHLLATVTRDTHEAIFMPDYAASIEYDRPGGASAEDAAADQKRC